MPEKEKLFAKWFHEHSEDMPVNLSTIGGLRAAFFGGLEAAEQSFAVDEARPQCKVCGTREHHVDANWNIIQNPPRH